MRRSRSTGSATRTGRRLNVTCSIEVGDEVAIATDFGAEPWALAGVDAVLRVEGVGADDDAGRDPESGTRAALGSPRSTGALDA